MHSPPARKPGNPASRPSAFEPTPRVLRGKPVRFREAVPDYIALLTGQTRIALDPFEKACLSCWSAQWSLRYLASLSIEEIEVYLKEKATSGGTPQRSLDREVSLLRSFYRWACRLGLSDTDPTLGMGHERPISSQAVAWTSVEQRKLLEACRGTAWQSSTTPPQSQVDALNLSAPRYLFPLALLGLRTGLRMTQILNIEWAQVDLAAGRIQIPAARTRNGKPIELALDSDSKLLLAQLLKAAHRSPVPPRRIFEAVGVPCRKGLPDEIQVAQAFRRVVRKAGITDGDYLSLRLTFVRNCAKAGVPVSYPLRLEDWDQPELVHRVYADLAISSPFVPYRGGPEAGVSRDSGLATSC
jgi:integrase